MNALHKEFADKVVANLVDALGDKVCAIWIYDLLENFETALKDEPIFSILCALDVSYEQFLDVQKDVYKAIAALEEEEDVYIDARAVVEQRFKYKSYLHAYNLGKDAIRYYDRDRKH